MSIFFETKHGEILDISSSSPIKKGESRAEIFNKMSIVLERFLNVNLSILDSIRIKKHKGVYKAQIEVGKSDEKKEMSRKISFPHRLNLQFDGIFHEGLDNCKKALLHEASKKLSTVKEIQKCLKEKSGAIVFGAPSSGKTEQLQIALGRKVPIFDMRAKFVEYYCNKHKIIDEKEIIDVKKSKYKKLKVEEREWIKENKKEIIDRLKKNDEKTIIFDEFDLAIGTNLNGVELDTAKTLLEIADELKKHNKEVILIMHQEGLHSKELMGMIKKELDLGKKDVVKTKYLTSVEEREVLKSLHLPPKDVGFLCKRFQGAPFAYLPLISAVAVESSGKDNLNEMNVEVLQKNAQSNVAKVYRVMNFTATEEVKSLLIKLAHDKIPITDERVQISKEALLETGLLGERHGHLVFPRIAKEYIARHTKKPEIKKLTKSGKLLLKTEHNFVEVDRYIKYEKKELELYKRVAEKLGGYKTIKLKGKEFIQPLNPKKIDGEYDRVRSAINKRIGLNVEQATVKQLKAWKNSDTSINSLIKTAALMKAPFINFCEKLAKEVNGKAHFGPNNRFALKSESSVKRKVKDDTNQSNCSKEESIQSIGDALRGTISCRSPEEIGKLVKLLQKECLEKGWKIGFKNIWETGRVGGYVGIHAKLYLRTPKGKQLTAELQLHLEEIYNGTSRCVKESNHEVYEYSREAYGPDRKKRVVTPPPFANQISRLQFLSHLLRIK